MMQEHLKMDGKCIIRLYRVCKNQQAWNEISSKKAKNHFISLKYQTIKKDLKVL